MSCWQASEAKQSVWTEDCTGILYSTPSIDYLTRKHLSALSSIVIDINCYHHRSNNLPPYSPFFISLLFFNQPPPPPPPSPYKTPMIPHLEKPLQRIQPTKTLTQREKLPLSHMNYPFFTNSKVLAESCLREFCVWPCRGACDDSGNRNQSPFPSHRPPLSFPQLELPQHSSPLFFKPKILSLNPNPPSFLPAKRAQKCYIQHTGISHPRGSTKGTDWGSA